jgi:hypothetical protein
MEAHRLDENLFTTGSSCLTPPHLNRSGKRTRICIQKPLWLRLKGLKRSLANWFTSLFVRSERKG